MQNEELNQTETKPEEIQAGTKEMSAETIQGLQDSENGIQKKDKRFLKGALVGALLMFLLLGTVGTAGYLKLFRGGTTTSKSVVTSTTKTKMSLLRGLIDRYYLYDVNEDDLENGMYEGYIAGLDDPYSVYYDEEATKTLLEGTSGQYGGIGAVLTQDEETGYLIVMDVYKDSPAEKAGIRAGDIIYKVDDNEIDGEDLSTIVGWVKGEEGTDVVIHLYRGEALEQLDLTATRAIVDMHTVEYEMKNNGVGYIRVSEFDSVTYDQFAEALTDLKNQGLAGLVIDLRSNPGGDVDITCNMLRLLLPKGTIVYTEDKDGKRTNYDCEGDQEFDRPLAILVNGNSASAAEIFTGAVQDYELGTVVGTTTYGKGVVQSLLNLQDGTYLKITTAEYFTPKGRSINKKGIEPDVKVEYEANNENPNADNQLDKAMEVVKAQIPSGE